MQQKETLHFVGYGLLLLTVIGKAGDASGVFCAEVFWSILLLSILL